MIQIIPFWSLQVWVDSTRGGRVNHLGHVSEGCSCQQLGIDEGVKIILAKHQLGSERQNFGLLGILHKTLSLL